MSVGFDLERFLFGWMLCLVIGLMLLASAMVVGLIVGGVMWLVNG